MSTTSPWDTDCPLWTIKTILDVMIKISLNSAAFYLPPFANCYKLRFNPNVGGI